MIDIILFSFLTEFYVVYCQKQISLSRQGIKTNRLAKGEKPIKTKRIETALLVATYGTAIIQYLSILFSNKILSFDFPLIIKIVGLVFTGLGVVFFILSTRTMRGNWRAGIDKEQKTKIVKTGIYRYSRNPAFVGFDFLYIGSFLVVPNLILGIFVVFTIVLLHLQILEEEKFLPSVFDLEYLEYKKETPRYLFL